MVYDNVSHISNDESDNLCKLATGFGFTARKLHTDDEETTIECTRPQIITAIDSLVAREDLGDRVLMATLQEITPDIRLSHSELKQKIYDSRPRIFGALLTALSQTLARLPHIQLSEPPRMKDYALFSVAAERALGLEDGAFMLAFEESRDRVRDSVIESSPVGEAILSFMRDRLVWKGTASELLKELESHTDDATYRSRYFPKAANHLSQKLNRLKPDLKALGIDVKDAVRSSSRETRSIVLEKVLKVSATSATNLEKSPQDNQGKGSLVADKFYQYPPLSATNPEVTRHLSATDELSATHPPLEEPLSGEGLNGVVADVADVADKKSHYSGSDRSKLNSDDLNGEKALPQKSNIENHKFSNSSEASPPSSPKFKIGDRVYIAKIEREGTIAGEREKKIPNGSFTEYRVDFGFDALWFEHCLLALVEVLA